MAWVRVRGTGVAGSAAGFWDKDADLVVLFDYPNASESSVMVEACFSSLPIDEPLEDFRSLED